jgi:hypothetical protein
MCWHSMRSSLRVLASANVCKITKNTKCSPLVESIGCDLSLESSINEDCNEATFVDLTCCWQPVGSLSTQMFAKSQKYKKFTVSQKYGLWLIIGIVIKENRNYVTFVCLTYCWQPVGSLSAQMFAKSHKYKMFTVCRKYGLWPIIGIVMKWGSQ